MPNEDLPIIFHTVRGICQKLHNESSSYNTVEAEIVIDYVKKLLQTEYSGKRVHTSDIGIVAPYREQCNVIKDECINNGFNGILIGTAEIFQGKERAIMIISTVRTDGTLGFVGDARVSLRQVTKTI